jgi:alkylation response protein AidB-like acyl-CoA dehydrogenase
MDLNESQTERAFRAEVRDFIAANLPKDLKEKAEAGFRMHMADGQRWHKILAAHGWGAPGWKKENGGLEWDPTRLYIWEEEMAAANCPPLSPFAVKMVGPVIAQFGTKEQKDKWLPPARSGEHLWCQGYSEPNSGSDLASLRTMAVQQGDKYIVNGMKIWNSYGHEADWMFALVRTSTAGKTQEGISVLLIDMKAKGISHRPIITIDGSHILNEIRFENVEVPVFNRIGEENKGWTYAKFLLGHERTNIAGVGASKRELQRLKDIARQETKNGRPLLEDPLFAARVAQVEIDLMALEMTSLRVLSAEAQKRTPGPEASILKIKGTEVQQALSELMMYAVGPYALPFERGSREEGDLRSIAGPAYAAPLAATYCNYRKVSIYGGSNEIQRNIISQMILGL